MMLWDIIRDWFVINVWGGMDHFGGVHSAFMGGALTKDGQNITLTNTFYQVPIKGFAYSGQEIVSMSLGDWLSTTSTIIVLIAVCVGLFFLVRYFFRMFAGLLSGR